MVADQAAKYSVFAWLAPVDRHIHWLFQFGPQSGFALETRYDEIHVGRRLGSGRQPGRPVRPGPRTRDVRQLDVRRRQPAGGGGHRLLEFPSGAARDLWVCMALGLILAGTLGNLYDRVVFNGVRDFLHWNYLFDWPVFNVADSCLVCGAGLLLLQAFGRQAAAKKDETEAVPAAATASPPAQASVSCMGVTPAHKA